MSSFAQTKHFRSCSLTCFLLFPLCLDSSLFLLPLLLGCPLLLSTLPFLSFLPLPLGWPFSFVDCANVHVSWEFCAYFFGTRSKMFLRLWRHFLVSSNSLPEIRSYSRATFCKPDSLSMHSPPEPALFRCGCVMCFNSAVCLPLCVDLYSASSFRSASDQPQLPDSMIRTEYSMR